MRTNFYYPFKFKSGDIIRDKTQPLGKWQVMRRMIDVDEGGFAYYQIMTSDNGGPYTPVLLPATQVDEHYTKVEA